LQTQEGQELFTVNGVQLQSGVPCNLIGEINVLRELGVEVLRLSPEGEHMEELVTLFHEVIEQKRDSREAIDIMQDMAEQQEWCNGFWHEEAGMNWKETQRQA